MAAISTMTGGPTGCPKSPSGLLRRRNNAHEVRMADSAHPTRARNVTVEIASGQHTAVLTVDQTIALPAGESFRTVGVVQLAADVETVITVTNKETDGFVIVDAIQLLPQAK